jgi:hypothetical protein
MNGSDLRDALRRDAELVGEPPTDLLERVEDLRRRSKRRRAGVVASALGVALVVAAIPVGGALLDQPAGGNVAAPADAPAPAAAEPTTPSVAEQRADAAEMFDITDPPDVPVIALVTPEQKGALVDACMTEAGWSPDRLFREGVPTESMPEVNLASYICEASYPIDPSYVGVPADEDRIID